MKSHFSFLGVVLGIATGVALSNTVYGVPPTSLDIAFPRLIVGTNALDNYGVSFFNNPLGQLKNIRIQLGDFTIPGDIPFGVTATSNQGGMHVEGDSIGILGTNTINNAGNYGHVGVVGQATGSTSQGIARGILGYVEPTSTSAVLTSYATPYFAPVSSGNLFGLYAGLGESRLADITFGDSITSTDGTVTIDDSVDIADTLTVDGMLTAGSINVDPAFYNANMLSLVDASSQLTGTNVIRSTIATCPLNSVRVSCGGRVTDTNTGPESTYRGVRPSGENACQASANTNYGGKVHAEALCMRYAMP